MPIDYEEYQRACKDIRKRNKKLLSNFTVWLKNKNLSQNTINNHVSNLDFYINEFLLYEKPNEPSEGINSVDMFLGYWFIRKAMWASKSTIKSHASSLKKFYKYMYENSEIEMADLEELNETIKEGMPEWLETLRRYDDPEIDDVWDY